MQIQVRPQPAKAFTVRPVGFTRQTQCGVMRSIRQVVAVATAVALFTVLGATSALGSETKTFTGLKDCTGFPNPTTPITGTCLIKMSSLKVLWGATVYYSNVMFLEDLSGQYLTSPVTLTAKGKNGSTATGRCTFYYAGSNAGHGLCTYSSGTGKLAGFHATIVVGSTANPNVYSLAGTYWFERHNDVTDND